MFDLTMKAIEFSLDGLAARQRVIAVYLANVDTPGYFAGRIAFEDNLRLALQKEGSVDSAEIASGQSLGATRMNGNNVNVDDENVALIETGLRFQLGVEAMNSKFRILRTSIRRDT